MSNDTSVGTDCRLRGKGDLLLHAFEGRSSLSQGDYSGDTLSFSTFSLPTDELLKELRRLYESGAVKIINAVLPSTHQRTADIITRAKTNDLCRLTGGTCKILKNHSKTLTIEGEKNLTILASSNFSLHGAIENYTVIYGIETVKAVNSYFLSKCYD